MHLNLLSLRNWCQFRELDVEFSDGMTALRGPNGSGKTNLINAILFALTGDLSRLVGTKVENICQLAEDGEESYVRLNFSHGTAEVEIERWLQPNRQRMHIAGTDFKQDLKNATEINAYVTELLGVNVRLLLDYVFVGQWQIFQFIDQKPEARAKAFHELFNVEKADAIWKALGDHKIDIPVPGIDGDRVRQRLIEQRSELEAINSELVEYDDLPADWIEHNDPNSKVLAEYGLLTTQQAVRDRLKESLEAKQRERTSLSEQITTAQQTYTTLDEAIKGSKELVATARSAISSWNTYAALVRNRDGLKAREAALLKESAGELLKDPAAGLYDFEDIPHKEKLLSDYRNYHYVHKKLLDQFDPSKKLTKCPTCNTPVENLQPAIEEASARVVELERLITDISGRINASKAFYDNWFKFQEKVKRVHEELVTIKARLEELKDLQTPTFSLEEAKQALEDFKEIENSYRDAHTTLHSLHNQRSNLDGRISSVKTQLLDAISLIDRLSVTQEQADMAKRELEDIRLRINRRNYLVATCKALIKSISDEEAALVKLAEEERLAGKMKRHLAHLNDVRTVFKELPQHASAACLQVIRGQVNKYLQDFDAPFQIYSIADLKFILKKTSGVLTAAERLSGGQRVVFAIAFRLAVNLKFADTLGLLCLDEPTAGLDADNLKCVEVALKRLRELSAARGLQVLLVTHDEGLDHLFDRVVQLPAAL